MDVKWYWCLHCERAFKGRSKCPYKGCDGSSMDRWSWDEVRAINPTYPEVPLEETVYRLYGPGHTWKPGPR